MNPSFKHLKRLSAVQSNTGIKFLTPSAFPGSHCPMHTALALTEGIEGLSSLVIGTPECSNYSRMIIENTEGKNGELHWMYVLDANEVVFGCREGLIKALEEMDRSGARAILLVVTCVPELIGEDMEAILYEVQPKLSARLAFVMMAHFRCNSYPSGQWKTMEALGGLMEQRDRQPNTVNILGWARNREDISSFPLAGLLKEKGCRLRYLAPGTSLEDFTAAPDAGLNIILSPFAVPLAKRMEKNFGIPFVSLHEAYSVAQIDAAYGEISSILGITWGGEFSGLREALVSMQAEAERVLKGESFISVHIGGLDPVPMADYLAFTGMEPLLLHLEEFYPEDRVWAGRLKEKGHDPMVCHMVNWESDLPLLEALSPSLCLGNLPGSRKGIPCIRDMHGLNTDFGYERTIKLLKKILRAKDTGTAEGKERV